MTGSNRTAGARPTGLVHLYCGDGKGKSTAAVGLAVRAAGAGMRVVFAQFLKNGRSSELGVLASLQGVEVRVASERAKFSFRMSDEEKAAACEANTAFLAGLADELAADPDAVGLLVLDEAVNACRLGLIDPDALHAFVAGKPAGLELVLTGRGPDEWLLAHADYITEMGCIRHPLAADGIKARRGVEF